MNARSPGILVAPLVPFLLAACGDKTYTSCPPAPLRVDADAPCDFTGFCHYSVPLGLGSENVRYCKSKALACSADGKLLFPEEPVLVTCPHMVPQCPAGAADGVACPLDPDGGLTNSECAVPGPGADLSQGIIHGQVCACDNPGPVWRCLPVDKTSL